MPIFIGSNEISSVALGAAGIQEVYAGAVKVWPSGPHPFDAAMMALLPSLYFEFPEESTTQIDSVSGVTLNQSGTPIYGEPSFGLPGRAFIPTARNSWGASGVVPQHDVSLGFSYVAVIDVLSVDKSTADQLLLISHRSQLLDLTSLTTGMWNTQHVPRLEGHWASRAGEETPLTAGPHLIVCTYPPSAGGTNIPSFGRDGAPIYAVSAGCRLEVWEGNTGVYLGSHPSVSFGDGFGEISLSRAAHFRRPITDAEVATLWAALQ
jgi:hypothetical protein